MKLPDILNNNSFCVMPWMNISTHTDGTVRLCCVSDEFMHKEDGTKLNLGYDELPDIINSTDLKRIRKDMLEGKPIKGCQKCYNTEKYGGESYRNWYNKGYIKQSPILKKIISSTTNDGSIDNTVEYFDIRFGNMCNLACRSCYPEASSQINKEVIKLFPISDIGEYHTISTKNLNDWYTTDVFEKNIDSQLENIHSYYMNGGEPTIIQNNLTILQKMIDSGVSKNINIKFNSNMTNNRKEFYDLLPHFKQIRFMCSIDGYGPMQEYLRYPSKWSQIDNTLTKLVSMGLTNLMVQPTPVIYKPNLEYITDLFDYFDFVSSTYNVDINISPIILTEPDYLDFYYLPLSYKQQCWEKIETWMKNDIKPRDSNFYGIMTTVKNRCLEEVEYKENLSRFFKFNDILDSNRNQKLSEVNPGLDSLR
jgi:sulfatase maturation enzyme AslB (radical SAM superfamily)